MFGQETLHADKRRAMSLSLGIGTLLLLVKLLAWKWTGSTAILSDALESIINVLASAFALFSVWLASKPPDENHPYGHGKIEYFSAGFEGGMITLAAAAILWTAIPRVFDPMPLQQLGPGMLFVLGTALVNCVLGLYLVRRGRETRSIALRADGLHLLTDVYTSVGVVAGLLLVQWTGYLWIDPLCAVLLALNILRAGWNLVRQSADRLLDTADPGLLEQVVDGLKSARQPGLLEPHQLRAIHAGPRIITDLHVFLPRFWDIGRANQEVARIESTLRSTLGDEVDVLIHADACRPRHCSGCALHDCPVRSAVFATEPAWTADSIKSSGIHAPDF